MEQAHLALSLTALAVSCVALVRANRAHRRALDDRALIEMLMFLREYDADVASDNAARAGVASAMVSHLSVKLASRKAIRPAGTWVLRAACGFRSPPVETPQPTGGRVA